MELQEIINQISILSAQFSEFKFWLVAGLAFLGVVAAVIVAASGVYMKSHVKEGIIAGTKEAQNAIDKTTALEKQIFMLQQKLNRIEESSSKNQWHDLTITAPTSGPVTGFGKYLKTQDGIVALYIDTYCDSKTRPIAILPEGFRPRRDVEFPICAIDVFNRNSPVPIKGHINSQGEIYARITSEGMQCPVNTLFVTID